MAGGDNSGVKREQQYSTRVVPALGGTGTGGLLRVSIQPRLSSAFQASLVYVVSLSPRKPEAEPTIARRRKTKQHAVAQGEASDGRGRRSLMFSQ